MDAPGITISEPIFNAIVLIDTPLGVHYATLVEQQVKTIETRTRRMIGSAGDFVICCGAKSRTANRWKALCLVHLSDPRPMKPEDDVAACVEWNSELIVHDITNWRYFTRKFYFAPRRVSGSFQSIFQISIPEDVRIITRP